MSAFESPRAERNLAGVNLQVRLRWIVLVALLPFMALGLIVLLSSVYELVCYDPAHFSLMYREKYQEPAAVARALESALQADDERLLAELQGLRRPARLASGPSIRFVRLLERTDHYITYLYVDMLTYERYLYSVAKVRERWVVAPPDLHFYLRSGQWRSLFLPLSVAWWVLAGLALASVWLIRRSARLRAWLLGD